MSNRDGLSRHNIDCRYQRQLHDHAVCLRSLFLLEGYGIDMYNKILWIRPNLLSTMNKHLTGGVLTTADAWGTLDYAESASIRYRTSRSPMTSPSHSKR